METEELGRALRAATGEVEPRPGFTAGVLRGGRRRLARRRMTVAGGVLVAGALAGGVAFGSWQPGSVQVAAASLLDQPTRGDLAGDDGFLAGAAGAWKSGLDTSPYNVDGMLNDRAGEPHVYWAGNTPDGPAAVLAQAVRLPAGSARTLYGVVGRDPGDGAVKLLDMAHPEAGLADTGAFRFGRDDRTVLAIDQGTPLYLSAKPVFGPDGKARREWRELRVADGVAITTVPEDTGPIDARLINRAPGADAGLRDVVPVSSSGAYLRLPAGQGLPKVPEGLPWRVAGEPFVARVGGARDSGVFEFGQGLASSGLFDQYTAMPFDGSVPWLVVAGLGDGRTALVGEHAHAGSNPSRVYAVLQRADGSVETALAGDPVDPAATLPVRFRLPDGQGWVVAAKGAQLSYRTGETWEGNFTDAALLPDTAVQVQVRLPGQPPVTVDLAK
ncbi:hypothetical protein [Amycolatopsis sp. 195334CR]|uniref:hypothetical protein n=1 Tax=Amycolatopsis sp. 195334CR TaxID=2814588 RepID=UPI001A8C3B8A|nr:hypothetical protein [Amycolatopsis sp. 195334CR]MBN6038734.1 hypothetical protein [Amycolatopsis sp. 195334CR]